MCPSKGNWVWKCLGLSGSFKVFDFGTLEVPSRPNSMPFDLNCPITRIYSQHFLVCNPPNFSNIPVSRLSFPEGGGFSGWWWSKMIIEDPHQRIRPFVRLYFIVTGKCRWYFMVFHLIKKGKGWGWPLKSLYWLYKLIFQYKCNSTFCRVRTAVDSMNLLILYR